MVIIENITEINGIVAHSHNSTFNNVRANVYFTV